MPIYGYRCTNPDCQHETEKLHGINEGGSYGCDICGYPMKRLLSAVPHKFTNPRGTMGIVEGGTGRREKHT